MKLLRTFKYSCCENCEYHLIADKYPIKHGRRKRKNKDTHWYFSELCVNPSCNDFDKIKIIIKKWIGTK
jgi:hypothetical protein